MEIVFSNILTELQDIYNQATALGTTRMSDHAHGGPRSKCLRSAHA